MFIPRLTPLTLAAAIALAGLGAPARAADRQDDRRDKARHRAPERSRAFRDRPRYAPHWAGARHRGYRQGPQRHARRELPRVCRIELRDGPARYDGRGLHRHGYRP